MSRRILHRYVVTGDLVVRTPVHVGGVEKDPNVDLTLAVDGQGDFYVPGSSLAGALRAWFHAHGLEEHLWGKGPERTGDDGFASRISVENAIVKGDCSIEVRNGVGIDRFFGRAADQIKFDREVLPRGTAMSFEMSLDADDEGDVAPFLAVVSALGNGELQLGAAQTRGLGRVALQDIRVIREDLASKAGILAALRGRQNPAQRTPLPRKDWETLGSNLIDSNILGRQRISIDWMPDGPLMVKADGEVGNADIAPLTGQIETTNENPKPDSRSPAIRLVLPGSSIKGVLRSHAERILSTVLQEKELDDNADQHSRRRFLNQMSRLPLIDVLFGAARSQSTEATRAGPPIGRGALTVFDCYSTSNASSLERAASGDVSLLSDQDARFELVTHVAIDRWTGGAAEGALYTVLEPWNTTWEMIELSIDNKRLTALDGLPQYSGYKLSDAAIALLHLVLRDFQKGFLALGFGTNRGLGAVNSREVKWPAKPELDLLQQAWSSYLTSERSKAKKPEHGASHV